MEKQFNLLARTAMKLASASFNDKTDRWEATVNGISNKGYGKSKEDALAMLRKIVDNNVRERPELEGLDDHENSGK